MTRARTLSLLGNENNFTVTGSNNVGIGSTLPDGKLDVGGDILVGTAITLGNVSGIVSATDFYVNGVSITGAAGTWATFTSGGEGGISTTKKVKIENGLEVTGISTFSGALTVGGVLTYADVTNVDSIGIITARDNIVLSGTNANIQFTDAAGSQSLIRSRYNLTLSADHSSEQSSLYSNLLFLTDGSEKVRIDSSGNVGIGTISPTAPLTVSANSASAELALKRANTNTTGAVGAINWQAMDGHSVASMYALGDGDDEGAHIIFATTSAASADDPYGIGERLRIDSAGQLTLNLPTNTTSRTIGIVNTAGTIGWSFGNGVTASARQFVLYDNEAGSARVVIDPNGGMDITGIVTCSNGASSGAGGHFGNVKIGFDSTYNTVETVTSDTVLHLNFNNTGDVEACRGGGEFLVGNNGSALRVGPSGFCTATQFDATSDVTLKENIEIIDNPIVKLSELKGVTFDWKFGGHSVGVIAQDVEKVLPTAVGGTEDRKTVNYNAIIGLLVESVKEQQKQIEELKSLLDK